MRTTALLFGSWISFGLPLAAQEDCNDLVPEVLGYSLFHEDSIDVRIVNNGQIGWSYPSLILSDDMGDTIAWAPADFFALAQESIFSLPITGPGVVPEGPFMARVDLWTEFNDSLRCSWHLPVVLCPPDSCTTIHPFVSVNIELDEAALFPWIVIDDEGATVGSGTMTIGPGIGSAMDTWCLPPGSYALEVSATGADEVNVFYQMMGTAWNTSSSPLVQMSEADASTFTLLGPCIEDDNAIVDRVPRLLDARVVGSELVIDLPAPSGTTTIELFDATGRTRIRATTAATAVRLDLDGVAYGTLLIKASDGTGIAHMGRVPWAR